MPFPFLLSIFVFVPLIGTSILSLNGKKVSNDLELDPCVGDTASDTIWLNLSSYVYAFMVILVLNWRNTKKCNFLLFWDTLVSTLPFLMGTLLYTTFMDTCRHSPLVIMFARVMTAFIIVLFVADMVITKGPGTMNWKLFGCSGVLCFLYTYLYLCQHVLSFEWVAVCFALTGVLFSSPWNYIAVRKSQIAAQQEEQEEEEAEVDCCECEGCASEPESPPPKDDDPNDSDYSTEEEEAEEAQEAQPLPPRAKSYYLRKRAE